MTKKHQWWQVVNCDVDRTVSRLRATDSRELRVLHHRSVCVLGGLRAGAQKTRREGALQKNRAGRYTPSSMNGARIVSTCWLVFTVSAFGQGGSRVGQEAGSTEAASGKVQAYDVVSIKPSRTGDSGGMASLPDGFEWRNANLWLLVQASYGIIMDSQVSGLPTWARSDFYNIEAKVDAATAERWKSIRPEERAAEEQQMMRSILADRCRFKAHQETKELPVYDLVIAKGGLKMKGAPADENPSESMTGSGRMTAHAVSVSIIALAFTRTVGRMIVDKTGFGEKKFDFELNWAPDNQPVVDDSASASPPLFAALQEQLGLKLVSSKGPVQILVIDHMERPSPN